MYFSTLYNKYVPYEVIALLAVTVVLQLLLQHSNVAYYMGPLKFMQAINDGISIPPFEHR